MQTEKHQKNYFKRSLSLFLSMVMIVYVFTGLNIAVSAASYSTGNYVIAASNGSNVRTGAGTSYSKVGAASKGTAFTVTKVSGKWGYTSSIKCTNGTKSGWVCLDYCTYKGSNNSSRSTYNDVFASLKGSGYSLSQARASEQTSFKKGDYVYVWAWLHDANNNLYKSYGSGTCNMTLSLYRPDGSCKYTYTYKNSDNNWIGCQLDQAGTWKIQSKITGSLSGTNTRTITVKENSSATYYTLSYNANGGSNAPSSQRVKANTGFYLSSSKPTRSGYTFLGWSTNKNATSASYSPNAGVKINSNITLYAVWKKNTTTATTYTGYVNTSSAPLVLRKSASTSSSALANMPKGSSLKVLDNKAKKNGFYHVTYNGITGYASAQYITFTKPTTTNDTTSGSFMIPMKSYNMTNGFGNYANFMRNTYYKGEVRAYHLGMDFCSVSGGDKNIYAFGNGTVIKTGWNNSNGKYIIIKHTISGKTVYSFYAHLNSYTVSVNQKVNKGTKIGVVGKTGDSARGTVHLHFAVADKLWSGSYWGYSTKFTGNKKTFEGVTYYNPNYIIKNGKLPS